MKTKIKYKSSPKSQTLTLKEQVIVALLEWLCNEGNNLEKLAIPKSQKQDEILAQLKLAWDTPQCGPDGPTPEQDEAMDAILSDYADKILTLYVDELLTQVTGV